jgi:hypothetical protein
MPKNPVTTIPLKEGGRKHIVGPMKLEEIAAEASKLTEEERAALASRLLHGLETPVYEVTDEELDRRKRETEEHPGIWITFDELVSGLTRSGN